MKPGKDILNVPIKEKWRSQKCEEENFTKVLETNTTSPTITSRNKPITDKRLIAAINVLQN